MKTSVFLFIPVDLIKLILKLIENKILYLLIFLSVFVIDKHFFWKTTHISLGISTDETTLAIVAGPTLSLELVHQVDAVDPENKIKFNTFCHTVRNIFFSI